MEIGVLIRNAAKRFGDAPALECDGRIVTFREFDQATDRIGNALLENPTRRSGGRHAAQRHRMRRRLLRIG